ncbi:MAG: 4-carboxy-4-hydroxy-2-oxoadipate aldolase/oxaloacetate decarboxylase [Candidatus Promineifilaceae bacterium]|nr:4-carboxy-4-hydroxy-2-oxoadipate aldolase/oxaloacetate decarboxylase [Candidatus Promineifilaceae bacterium]
MNEKQSEQSRLNLFKQVGTISTATLHEAMGKTGALPSDIKPLNRNLKLIGTAITVQTMPADNLLLHRALALASSGDVIVVNVSNHYEAGYWGEIMTVAALERGIAGLVIDGCVRDADAIEMLAFPVFCRGLCIKGTTKFGNGTLNQPIIIGHTMVRAGDTVVGDRDGVVVIPTERLPETIDTARKREKKEAETMAALRSGKSTLEIYGWD